MKNISILVILCSVLVLAACQKNSAGENKKYLTVLSSTQNRYKFCNGAQMNSDEFRKTITKVQTTKIALKSLSQQQQLNVTALLVIKQMKGPNLAADHKGDYVTLKGTTAYIKPIDAWAGVSIYLCAYKPLLEVNLLQYPFVKKVVWS